MSIRPTALFGSINFLPNDRLDLGAGIRFSTDEKDFAAERPDPVFQSPTIRPITAHTDEDIETTLGAADAALAALS